MQPPLSVIVPYNVMVLYIVQGYAVDFEGSGRKVPCYDLFMRLMEEER